MSLYTMKITSSVTEEKETYKNAKCYLETLGITGINKERAFWFFKGAERAHADLCFFTDLFIIRYVIHEKGRSVLIVPKSEILSAEIVDHIGSVNGDRVFLTLLRHNITADKDCVGFKFYCDQNEKQLSKKLATELIVPHT